MKPERHNVIRQHSGWLIPLGFALAILALSALFLAWYLRPGPQPGALTASDAPVALSVRGLRLAVPANYITSAASRSGGHQDTLALAALLPDMRGYSEGEARLFAGNAPDSAVVRLLFKGDPNSIDAAQRLARIYLPYVADPAGGPGPFGLTRYDFRPDSVYGRDELFAGMGAAGLVLILCERGETALPSPNCLGSATPPASNLGLSFRFKRAWLPQWRQIASGVDGLVARFEKP